MAWQPTLILSWPWPVSTASIAALPPGMMPTPRSLRKRAARSFKSLMLDRKLSSATSRSALHSASGQCRGAATLPELERLSAACQSTGEVESFIHSDNNNTLWHMTKRQTTHLPFGIRNLDQVPASVAPQQVVAFSTHDKESPHNFLRQLRHHHGI